jgi:chemotaxis protein methyltransferase CheR
MKDADCIAFLKWALPRMQLQWAGFRKVRKLVCKRIDRRCRELGLGDVATYRQWLEATSAEWATLHALCAIPISRFYRDPAVFESLERTILPALAETAAARGQRSLECWSAGCASGEEPYTLAIIWELALAVRDPGLELHVLATDIDPVLLQRAAAACYRASALKDLPGPWRTAAFEMRGAQYCLRERFRAPVTFACQDLCATLPERCFDLILCRNLAFTYFERSVQERIARQIAERLNPGGVLMIGIHEELPGETADLIPWAGAPAAFRRSTDRPAA